MNSDMKPESAIVTVGAFHDSDTGRYGFTGSFNGRVTVKTPPTWATTAEAKAAGSALLAHVRESMTKAGGVTSQRGHITEEALR